ncbi:MAG: DHHA1 domain-containing protein, partial [Nitrososphaerales archaeon]
SNLKVVHSLRDCTAALTYNYFKSVLPKEASILAAYAALTDYLEDGPIASEILDLYDRIHLYYEASILAYAVEQLGKADKKLQALVEELSRLKYPHEIDGVLGYAYEHAHQVSAFMNRVRKDAVVRRSYAYIDALDFPKGTAANLVRCLLEVPVGLAYTVKSNSFVELSLRASSKYTKDLGSISQRLASRFGGFGGGHAKASGARIPKDALTLFLKALEDSL